MKAIDVLGTPLRATTYSDLTRHCQERVLRPGVFAVDFTNTHIVTLRRTRSDFRALTECVDYFVPDGMPLVWCLNRCGAGLKDRVYGPTFMRQCVLGSPKPWTHYFLGGSEECVGKVEQTFVSQNPDVKVVGRHHGYFKSDDENEIVAEINRLSPDFIWVGLGTPNQQRWISRWKGEIRRGGLMAVGFAFDVNAGTKPDAPPWMQRRGLGWLYRLVSEPVRLGPRYLRFNTTFLFYLMWDGLRGRAFRVVP